MTTGILFVGHGSRLDYNKKLVEKIAEKYKKINPENSVEAGFMELVEPDIPTAFNKLKDKNVDRIIVNPIFLANGMHTRVDIPTILGIKTKEMEQYRPHTHNHEHTHTHEHHHHHHREAKSEIVDFDGEIVYLEPLGSDDKIVQVITERINHYINQNPDITPDNTAILLIGHGSTLPYNNQVVEDIAEKYTSQTKDYPVEVGFMQLSKPTIPEAVEKLKKHDIKRIIAAPVFLAHGIHTKIDIPLALNMEAEEIENYTPPEKDRDTIDFDGEVILTRPIEADDTILDLIDQRIQKYL